MGAAAGRGEVRDGDLSELARALFLHLTAVHREAGAREHPHARAAAHGPAADGAAGDRLPVGHSERQRDADCRLRTEGRRGHAAEAASGRRDGDDHRERAAAAAGGVGVQQPRGYRQGRQSPVVIGARTGSLHRDRGCCRSRSPQADTSVCAG